MHESKLKDSPYLFYFVSGGGGYYCRNVNEM